MNTSDGPEAGIVRFPVSSWNATRHGTVDYIDVNLGLDGKLYALRSDEASVDLFDPQSMTGAGKVTLPVKARAVAANAQGEIFAATWSGSIVHVSGGTVTGTMTTGFSGLADIDLGYGVVVASSAYGGVVVTNENLVGPVKLSPAGSTAVFVALVPPP